MAPCFHMAKTTQQSRKGGNDEHMANVGFASSCKSLFVDYETCLVLLGVDTLVPSSDNVPFSMP